MSHVAVTIYVGQAKNTKFWDTGRVAELALKFATLSRKKILFCVIITQLNILPISTILISIFKKNQGDTGASANLQRKLC